MCVYVCMMIIFMCIHELFVFAYWLAVNTLPCKISVYICASYKSHILASAVMIHMLNPC